MDFTAFQNIVQNTNPQEGVIARFYDKAVKTGEISQDGLPVFINKCFVEIRIRDNNCEVYNQPATEAKIKQFPVEYARYQLAKTQIAEGTPIEQFAFLTAAEIESLKVRGIFSVETLAHLDDDKARQLEILTERNLAQKFMEQAQNNKNLKLWQQKEETYLREINALKEELSILKRNSFPKYKRRI